MAQASEERGDLRLLLIEDNEDDAFLLAQRFRSAGYRVHCQRLVSLETLRGALAHERWDLVISDHGLPGFDALSALALVRAVGHDMPFLIVSGLIQEEQAVAAMRAGANDYLSKNRLERLVPAAERELREARNRREQRRAQSAEKAGEARLSALASNTPGVIFQFVHHPGGALRFLYVGGSTHSLLGMTPDDLLDDGSRFVSAILDRDQTAFEDALDRATSGGAPQLNWEGRIRAAEGDIKWVNLRASVRYLESGEQVWDGLMWNITHSKQAECALLDSRRQLAELSNHLEVAKEAERERIARDVHDVLGGNLVALKIEAALLASELGTGGAPPSSRMKHFAQLIDDAIATVSRVTRELRPGILKDFGLPAAIESQAEDFSQRTGLPCEMRAVDYDIEIPEARAVSLFRIFQEALTNICKHADADRVSVRLVQEGDDAVLEIADNGKGMAEDALRKPHSFGLRGIRERVLALGGDLEILPAHPSGTRLVVRAPVIEDIEPSTMERP